MANQNWEFNRTRNAGRALLPFSTLLDLSPFEALDVMT